VNTRNHLIAHKNITKTSKLKLSVVSSCPVHTIHIVAKFQTDLIRDAIKIKDFHMYQNMNADTLIKSQKFDFETNYLLDGRFLK